jgi:U3 small nucleolar RNA-associated protein 16
MLTNIYNTAKRILSRSPSAPDRASETRDTPPTSRHIEVTMVTTRRGTETPGQDSTATPRSSGKRRSLKRELEALETPTAAKRQKKTTPKKRVVEDTQEPVAEDEAVPDSAEDTSDTVNVAIPRTQTPNLEDKLPIRPRSSPKVVVAKPSPPATEADGAEEAIASTQEDEFHTPEPQSDAVYATPATSKKRLSSPTPRAKRASERTTSAKKSSARKKAAPVETEESADEATPTASSFPDEIASSTQESDQAPTPTQDAPPKKAHLRFGSEDPEEAKPKVNMNIQGHKRYEAPHEVADSDDDASDSDEAPEVITTSAAASKAKSSQADAARALLAQQEKERTKREAREQRIAEEQAEKRKRNEKKAKKLAKHLAKQQPKDTVEPSTTSNIDLSGLLPTSLLSNLPDQRAPTPPPVRGGKTEEELRNEKLRHHIKFLERTDKGPKDVKKGKLSVAVLGQQNRVLPPKANRATRNVREKWLKGRQVEVKKGKGIGGKMERKAFGNRGFLKGDD